MIRRKIRWTAVGVAAAALCALSAIPAGAQLVSYDQDLPRIMLFLEEDGSTATSQMSSFLRDAGFRVIDPAFARTSAERELAREALDGDDQAATALGRNLGAQVLILGTVPAESQPSPAAQSLQVATAHLSVRAIRLDDPRIVSVQTADGRGLDATGTAASEKAKREALDKVLHESSFVGDLVIDWEENPWNDEGYWEPSPGSVEAQMGSSSMESSSTQGQEAQTAGAGSGSPLQIAILESETYPDEPAEGTRGIEIVTAQPVRARIRGLISATDASVEVGDAPARVRALTAQQQEDLGLTRDAAEFTAEVRLPSDRSMVRITARSRDESTEVEVSPRVGERWAVVVGISDYADEGITPLQYADDDAQAMYDFLRSPIGGEVPEENIRLLLNEEATGDAIREALFVFLQEAAPEDFVTVYIASHGSPDPERQSNLYILPYDTDTDAFASTAFPMWDVKTALRRQIRSERVVVIADACRSAGTLVDDANPVAGAFSELFSPSRRMTISAAGLNEVSFEDARWGGGHGVFTYHLLQGLEGAADSDQDGVVSFREAARHVETEVARATDERQHPQWSGLGDVPMSYVGQGSQAQEDRDEQERDRQDGETP